MNVQRKRIGLLALCLSALLTGLLATSANAISTTDTGTIRVSGVEDGVTVTAYQLMQVNYDYIADQPIDPVYVWAPSVQTWVDSNYPAYSDANAFNDQSVDATISATFFDKAAAAIKGGSITLTSAGTRTGSGDLAGLPMGSYLVLIENGMKVYRPSAVNLIPTWSDTDNAWFISSPVDVVVKSSEPSLDKSINESVSDGHTSGAGAVSTTENIVGADNASIGASVNFDLRADIPQYPANALAHNYSISDKLSDGLTLDVTSIRVYGVSAAGAETLLTEGTDYTVSAPGTRASSNTNTTSFTVTFTYNNIKTYTKIHIDYNASVNENAVIGTQGNDNIAYLDFSNNPYDASSWQTKEDKVILYSYGIDLTKTDKNTPTTLLPGAQFSLSTTEGGSALSFVNLGSGRYRLAKAGETGTTTVLEVGNASAGDDQGKLILSGLDAGLWYLAETKAPDGYNKISASIQVSIMDDDYDGAVTVADTELTTGLVPVTVQNSQGFTLPTTGGMGTIAFTAVGIALMGAGLIAWIALRRKKSQIN